MRKWGKGVGGGDDEEWAESTQGAGAENGAWDGQQADEGGRVWDADENESAWQLKTYAVKMMKMMMIMICCQ